MPGTKSTVVGKNKQKRFADNKSYRHVIQAGFHEVYQKNHSLKGKWQSDFFKNENPIVLELGCGRGEYTVGLAKRFPDKNFIGVDIKGARLWKGAKTVQEDGMKNAAFVRTRIDFITSFFDADEVDEIWITFPDPQPKKNQARKRLTGPLFIDRYRRILRNKGLVHLKTDSNFFFEYTLEQIKEHRYEMLEMTRNLYGEKIDDLDAETADVLSIRTFYETLFLELGEWINYVRFQIH